MKCYTYMSCQETDHIEGGSVWIAFVEVEDAQNFLNFVTDYDAEDGSLYQRILGERIHEKNWYYQPEMSDFFTDTWEQAQCGVTGFNFSMSVYFPVSDLETVYAGMREWNTHLRNKPTPA